MSATPLPQMSDPLLPANDFSVAPDALPQPTLRVVGEPGLGAVLPQPDLPAAAAADPLHAVRLLSEEEKIALCS